MEQVENVIKDGDCRVRLARRAAPFPTRPLLQATEAGQAVLVQGDHLAVEDRLFGPDQDTEVEQLGELFGGVATSSREQSHLALTDKGQRPEAVELQLVVPPRVVESG